MILCLCKGVSDRTVRLAIASGAQSVEAVGARCGAGTDCRSCRHAIQDLVDDAQAVPMACDGCQGDLGHCAADSAATNVA
ncbi:MAG TPA: (2Fe-2S)-binding protein [Polyangia bacterium]|jgi:bacterioferritin-associated ferredoxin|nr:(2Fe-2S)-binding protein [Polyangia bacterium]